MMNQNILVKQIKAEQTRELRHLVLWPHIKHTEECVIDVDQRSDAIHLGAFTSNRIISVCSLFKMETGKLSFTKQYRLRAMATHPDARGIGAGRAVVEKAVEVSRDMGMEVLWCDARKVAMEFYHKCGFLVTGDFYQVRNIGPHKLMYCIL